MNKEVMRLRENMAMRPPPPRPCEAPHPKNVKAEYLSVRHHIYKQTNGRVVKIRRSDHGS